MSKLKVSALQGLSASSDAITLANDGTCTANITNNLSNRNLIINGAMQVAEHSNSNAGAHNTYAVDRFNFIKESTAANFTMSQSTTSPDGFSKSLKMDCTAADTSTAHNEFVMVRYNIEAHDLQQLGYGTSAAKPLVLSFYVRSSLTGTYVINLLQADNSNKLYSRTYTINSADTWERKTISIPADTSGVINDDNGLGLQINFGLTLGSTYKGAGVSPTWESFTNDRFGSQHGVNFASSTSNEWYLTGVQLEVNTSGVATDFEHRSYGDELAKCQRYYFKITADDNDSVFLGYSTNGSNFYGEVPFPTSMRTMPTYTGSGTAARYFSSNTSDDFNFSALAIHGSHTSANPHHTSMYVAISSADGGTAGVCQAQNAVGTLEFSAEL